MKKVDITDKVLEQRKEAKRKEMESLSKMTLPDWMQKPFDEYFASGAAADPQSADSNIVHANFEKRAFFVPKSLAASSIATEQQTWYDCGSVAFSEVEGSLLSITFNKSSDSQQIDIIAEVTEGSSPIMQHYMGQSDISCCIFDKDIKLASLQATFNHSGTFMHAEGTIIEDYEPNDGNDHITIQFENEF